MTGNYVAGYESVDFQTQFEDGNVTAFFQVTFDMSSAKIWSLLQVKYSDDHCVSSYPAPSNTKLAQEFCARLNAKPIEPRTIEQVTNWLHKSKSEHLKMIQYINCPFLCVVEAPLGLRYNVSNGKYHYLSDNQPFALENSYNINGTEMALR